MIWKISPSQERAQQPAPEAIAETAARWSEILREGVDPETRASFEAWRASSQENALAFQRVQVAHALTCALAATPQMQALREEALARAAASRCRMRRLRAWPVAASFSLFIAAALGMLALNADVTRQTYTDLRDAIAGNIYRTGVGERTVVRLDDGSVLTLNTDTRVRVHDAPGLRRVTLERGQALFNVAKDAERPFVVDAGGRRVTALGTEFDVNLSGQTLEVTLLEGRVSVAEAHARDRVQRDATEYITELRPGEQFVAAATRQPQVRVADVKRVVSWRQGLVVFEDERLEDAINEMNRYSRRQIVLNDADLAALKISGAFNTGDTDTFVGALIEYFPIEQVALEDQTIALRPRVPAGLH